MPHNVYTYFEGIPYEYEYFYDGDNLILEEVKNKLKTLTQGQKSDRVIEQMAMTFRALCSYADWTEHSTQKRVVEQKEDLDIKENTSSIVTRNSKSEVKTETGMNLHYNIQIHLPETTNMAVYDAIFQSLKKHLM